MEINHRSGYVNIIGLPNIGKSTLMNSLVGERLSIITSKPQTTRHRIIGIVNDDNSQIIFSDTPGFIKETHYELQSAMNDFVMTSFDDADVIIFMVDVFDDLAHDDRLIKNISKSSCHKLLVINKVDLKTDTIEAIKSHYTQLVDFASVIEISALNNTGVELLMSQIVSVLPEGPPFYPKDQLTDRPERFFVSEIIRQSILEIYHKEIPYSCEVLVTEFKEKEEGKTNKTKIRAEILVNRQSQKAIIIGKNGQAIKKLGTESRMRIEEFIQQEIFLELYVKVKEKWRDSNALLKSLGYKF